MANKKRTRTAEKRQKAKAAPTRACCKAMRAQLDWRCETHRSAEDCPDALIAWVPARGVFALLIHDGGTSYIPIQHCPWCGARLPGKRDALLARQIAI